MKKVDKANNWNNINGELIIIIIELLTYSLNYSSSITELTIWNSKLIIIPLCQSDYKEKMFN